MVTRQGVRNVYDTERFITNCFSHLSNVAYKITPSRGTTTMTGLIVVVLFFRLRKLGGIESEVPQNALVKLHHYSLDRYLKFTFKVFVWREVGHHHCVCIRSVVLWITRLK